MSVGPRTRVHILGVQTCQYASDFRCHAWSVPGTFLDAHGRQAESEPCNVSRGRGIRDDVRPVWHATGEGLALSSFAGFYESERERAVRLAWLLTHDPVVAEDVVQDVFTALFHRFDQLDNPAAYLRRSVINAVYERNRRSGREARRLALAAGAAPTDVDGPTGGLIDAVAALPLQQRTVVVLRYWSDLDHATIADAMDVPVGTVRSLLSRATAQLRKEIEP